jgi:hypothetical protein
MRILMKIIFTTPICVIFFIEFIVIMTVLMFALISSLVSIVNITADNLLSPQNLEPNSYKFLTFAIIAGVLGGCN